jgi:hypothetical protein
MLGLAWTLIFLFTPPSWDHRHSSPCPACWLTRGLTNFLPKLALKLDPLISTSQVAGITGVSHGTRPRITLYRQIALSFRTVFVSLLLGLCSCGCVGIAALSYRL